MATVPVTLTHGLKIGEDTLKDAVLREPTAGDIIEAQEEAEKLVYTVEDNGNRIVPTLVASPTMVGVHVLRRQIVKIGNLSGPIELDMIKRLHPEDFGLLQAKADELDAATSAEIASREVAQRGRTDADGGDAG